MIINMAESFWTWYRLTNMSNVFGAILTHFSIVVFLKNFRDFYVFAFMYRAQNGNPQITENL